MLLTPAYRSLSRPSSSYSSQASAINLYSLDHIIIFTSTTNPLLPQLSGAFYSSFAFAARSTSYSFTTKHSNWKHGMSFRSFLCNFKKLCLVRLPSFRLPVLDRPGKETTDIFCVYTLHCDVCLCKLAKNRRAIFNFPFLKRR